MKSAACHEQKTIYLHLHYVKHATNHRYSSRGHFYAAVCLVLLLYWNQLFVYPWLVRTMDHEEADDNDIRTFCLVDQWLLCYYKKTGFSTIGCNKNQLITIIISICFFIYCSASIYIYNFLYHYLLQYKSTNFSVKDKKGKKPFFESQLNANIYKEF